MYKLGGFGGFTVGASPDAVQASVDHLNADIVRIHNALVSKCGKSFTVKFDDDPMYGCVSRALIVATGKDMTAHIMPYLKKRGFWDYGEEWWLSDFGQDTPILKPRKQYHLTVDVCDEHYMFRERCVIDGVVAF